MRNVLHNILNTTPIYAKIATITLLEKIDFITILSLIIYFVTNYLLNVIIILYSLIFKGTLNFQ